MRYIKALGLALIGAASLAAFAAPASATILTSPIWTTYTSEVRMTSTNWELDGAFVTIKCTHSVIKFKVEQHSEVSGKTVPAGGKLSEWYFAGCNYPVSAGPPGSAGSPGSLEIDSSNAVRSTGATIHAHTSVGTCDFTTNVTRIGTLTEGTKPVVNLNSSSIPRTSGSFLCGSAGVMTGSYEVITPKELFVD